MAGTRGRERGRFLHDLSHFSYNIFRWLVRANQLAQTTDTNNTEEYDSWLESVG